MKRIVVSAALILVLAGPLARDESWTPAAYAAVLRQMEEFDNQDSLTCDCAAPSPECVEICNAEPGPGICDTGLAERDQLLREALIRGARPDVIAELIRQHPFAPFSREVLVKIRPRSQAR